MPPRILPIKRQATVYDKTALKVRINGRRISVPDSELTKAQARADAEAKHIKPLIRTSKGKNWIAPDVYSFERIPEKRDFALDNDDEDDDDESEFDESTLRENSKKRTRPEPKTYDGKRRRLNNSDLSFISNPYASYTAVSEPSTSLDPSSDLLKTIHYFTSEFYDASGQLFNSTRKTVLRKQTQELQQSEEPDSGDGKSVEDDEGIDANEDHQEDDEETDATGDHQEDDSESDSYKPDQSSNNDDDDRPNNVLLNKRNLLLNKRRESRRNQTKQRHLQKLQEEKDMYTAFDGSALFCIGMLLKAHVISQLESTMPESWDDEVAAYKEFEEDLRLRNSDGGSEEEEEENLDDKDSENQNQNRKEKYKQWENKTLSSARRMDDLKIDFVSPEYSRL